MISCPNKRLKVWKDLVQNVGENNAYVLWAEYDGNVPDDYYQNNIQSNKSKEVKIKEDIEDLFESNPELANAVYEALGVKSNPDVILPIGTSGSGKSTFIKSLPQENLVVIEPDAMRVEFTGDMNDKSKDKEIYIEAANRAIKAIKQGKQVVFDTTNLTKEKRLPFIEAIKKAIPNANIQYKLMELNPELAKQRIKVQLERGENRAAVSDETIDRHAESYKQMLEDIKNEPISNFELTLQQKQQAQQLYSQYLETIFPDSKVKDIVYHGTNVQFDKFKNITRGFGYYFGDKRVAKQYSYQQWINNLTPQDKKLWEEASYIDDTETEDFIKTKYPKQIQLPSLLNIKNPKIIETFEEYDNLQKSNKYDSGILEWDNQYVVFEPEQIHILGSKQDIEGFKEFVNKDATPTTFFKEVDFTDVTTSKETNIFENSNSVLDTNNQFKEISNTAEHNRILFNNKQGKITIDEILENILFNIKELTPETKLLIEKSRRLFGRTGAKFQFVSPEQLNSKKTLMQINTDTNTIQYSRERIKSYSTESVISFLLHELAHAQTVKALENPETFEEIQFRDLVLSHFGKYFNKAANKKLETVEDFNVDDLSYGFKNEHEFVAEIYSNPQFIQELKNLDKKEKTNFWNTFINYFRKMLGLQKTTKINNLVESVINYVEADHRDYTGLKGKRLILDKQENTKTELDTIEKQLNHNIERINESLKINIDKYKYLSKVFKDNEGILTYLDTLEQLRSDINQFKDINQIKGVVIFLETMGKTLDFIENKLDTIDYTNHDNLRETAKIYDSYLSTYSVIEDIKDLVSSLSQDKEQTIISNNDLEKLKSLFYERLGKYSSLNSRFLNVKQDVTKKLLNNIKYFPKIEKDHYDRLSIEHRNNKIPTDKDVWIIDKMLNRDKDLIQKDLDLTISEFVKNPAFDIYASDVTFSSAINISSPLVQIMNTLLIEIDNKRLIDERAKDLEFKELFEKLVTEKGTNNIDTLYKNILDTSKTGKKYLLNEYKADFLEEVNLKIKSIKNEVYQKTLKNTAKLVELSNKGLINSKEYQDISTENNKLKKDSEIEIKKLESENLITDKDGKIIGIKDKWKNNLSNLSKTEREMLDFFIKISQDSHNNTFGKESLINFTYRINDNTDKFSRYVGLFYELPKITKSDTERIWNSGAKDIIKDKWKDLTQIRPDDIGYSSVETDMTNKPIHRLKIHYRNGQFNNKDQSLDLMNIYRLEYKNTSSYKYRREAESDLNFLLDIARNKKYYEKAGTQNAINKRNKKFNEIEGENSNTFKMMQNMMEMKFYDILNKTGTKIGNVEMNKVADGINRMQAFLALSANIASGTANVINAKSQLFLESIYKGHFITAGSIKKAESIYFKDLPNNLADLTNGISVSFTNQMLEMFNVRGNFNFSDANFLRSDMIKMGLHTEALQVFQDSGEHWIQSVTTMSVLDGIKVMNENNEFIDKKGNVVESKDKAASLLDMMSKNKDGLLKVNSKVVYTTHSRLTKWNEGGKEKIDLLLVKKINDVIGNYRKTDQPDIKRHWWGKLVMLFRGYLVSMGQARLRGVEYSLTSKEKLTDEQRRFSNALQEYEEGTYVTLIRYLKNSIKGVQTWAMLKDNWQNLTDYERHNVKRSVTEIILTAAILPMLSVLFAGAAADDDNEYLYFVAYQIRRLETELSSYRDPREMIKMLRSPIPSVRLLEHALTSIETIINPFSWNKLTEEYKVGKFKGQNKFLIKQQKQIPILKEFMKSYNDWYQFQNANFAGVN